MHVLMLHLQMSPLEHRPMVASLLLQLDILVNITYHRTHFKSMYRTAELDLLASQTSKLNLARLLDRQSLVNRVCTERRRWRLW